jgi:enamine deaminase RidA (YjgF/YER057c/UK114 family)
MPTRAAPSAAPHGPAACCSSRATAPPHDPARGIVRGATPQEQVRQALAVISGILAEAGSGLDRTVQVTMLITDPADYAACNEE